MGLGFSPWGRKADPLSIVAQTHADAMADVHRDHLAELSSNRTRILEAASALDLLGDTAGHIKALSLAAEYDTEIERAEAQVGEWSA